MTNQLTIQKQDPENKLMTMLKSQVVRERFIETVGPTGGAWITAIINAANLNPAIWDCEPVSVITAGLNAAILRLSVDPSTGQAAIVPFRRKNKESNQWYYAAVFVPMVRGIKQLALRTGQYRWINDTPIYDGEEIIEDRMSGELRLEGAKKSDEIIGYLAAFKMVSGYGSALYMPIADIMAHAQKYSPTFDKRNGKFYPGSMWLENFDAMARKTPLRLLLLRDGVLDTGSRNMLEAIEDNEPTVDAAFTDELETMIENDPDDLIDPDAEPIPFDEGASLRQLGF